MQKAHRRTYGLSLAAAGAAAVSLIAYYVVRSHVIPSLMLDFRIYRIEGGALRDGKSLYSHLHLPLHQKATYPPFAAMLFVPFDAIPLHASKMVANAINFGLLVVVCWQSSRLVGVAQNRMVAVTVLLAAVTLWAEPVFTTFGNGQINLLLLALVLWDFLLPAWSRWRGVGSGLAAGIKITPGVFIVYLLLTRRYRAAATALATFAATVVISALVVPTQTKNYWTHYLFASKRVGKYGNGTNQSVLGVIARTLRSNALGHGWLAVSLLVLAAGLLAATYVYRRSGEAWGLCVCAVAGLLSAPIAWSHHWVWCIPITLLLVTRKPRWAPIVAVFWAYTVYLMPHKPFRVFRLPDWKIAMTDWYVLFGFVFVALAVETARRARAPVLPRVRTRL